MLGKTLALASASRSATYHGERARELEERIDFARDIHDGVVQRLFGVSLALSSEQPLTEQARGRCAAEVRAALGELRSALQRPLGRTSPPTGTTLAASSNASARSTPTSGSASRAPSRACPPRSSRSRRRCSPRPCATRASTPTPQRLVVRSHTADGALVLEDRERRRAGAAAASTGVGLRLAALRGAADRGVVEFGERGRARGRCG